MTIRSMTISSIANTKHYFIIYIYEEWKSNNTLEKWYVNNSFSVEVTSLLRIPREQYYYNLLDGSETVCGGSKRNWTLLQRPKMNSPWGTYDDQYKWVIDCVGESDIMLTYLSTSLKVILKMLRRW